MAESRIVQSPAWSRLVLVIAVAATSAVGVAGAITGPGLVIAGLLAVGPCLAAISARPAAVVALGAYALVLLCGLAQGLDQIGRTHELLYAVGIVTATGIGVLLAARGRSLELYAVDTLIRLRTADAIMRDTDDAIIAKTLDGTIIAWNPGAERLYGYSATEANGMNITRLAGPAGPDEVNEVLSRIATGQHVDHYETQRSHRDGSVVDVSVSVSPVRDQRGHIVGASVVARDITARKRDEESRSVLEHASQQAQRMQSLGQLAGGVAHDFNNLLTVIINYADMLDDHIHDDREAAEDLDKIRTAADRAAGLTRQLLLFSRGEVVQTQVIDLNVAVTETRDLLTRTLGETVTLIALTAHDPVFVDADPGRIQQVLVNLAVNARDAMPDGGTLVIETTLTHRADRQPPTGRLLVSDTGKGMSSEVTARIFEPFFTTKALGKGTGLGLATVYGIVTDAGGMISVHSKPDLGTTFLIDLPLVAGGTAAATATPGRVAHTPAPSDRGQLILVVEDQDDLRQVIIRTLQRGGYRVHATGSGHHALQLDHDDPCDLLLTDIVMPEMTGPQLAALLRERRPDLAMLYMSGYNDELLTPRHLTTDRAAFIAKPFTTSQLLDRVSAVLRDTQPIPTHR